MTAAQRVRFLALRAGRAGTDRAAALAEAIGDPGASEAILAAVVAGLPQEAALDALRRVLQALGVEPSAKEPNHAS
jgi:hypothetical protein